MDAATSMIFGVCHEDVLSALLQSLPPDPAPVDDVVTTVLRGIAPR